VLDAYVLGFEVECKLGRAIGEPHYALGWHATSTLGTMGAAAACARLMGLDAARTRNSLGIAASLASGLQQNFGTMTKPLHAGWAAHNGVLAASLASRGFEADPEAIEGPSGFLRAMSGGAEINAGAAVRGMGEPWEVVEPGIGVKLYPCCYAIARSIDAALQVRSAVRSQDVSAVEVVVSPGTLIPLRREVPAGGLEAKFNLEYCVATALIDGRVGLEAFRDETVARREDVRALAARIAVREAGEQLNFPIEGRAEVRVTANGGSHSADVAVPLGDPKNPLTWDDLAGKFRDCAGTVLPADRVEAAIGLVSRLDELRDTRALLAAIGGIAEADLTA
jgi:2-methylcitrate dehydratase PrpD